ncbi:hypothetical protein IF188_09585 [Microbacterium sp. NEAU-LLC]|uniref:Uncharacterized protein n=1 Tax=Microbacterium helvum TaxID=2773713 RepID=A0ABR8NMR0_9MICO|nr:hypothetical protein [Microbacterium helvum]MBD3941945.1 hypothetical protein [Microbacterium helvum]
MPGDMSHDIPLPLSRRQRIQRAGATLVALVLAVGICTALNLFVFAVLYDALVNGDQAGISENATQILSGWGGGIISIISAVVGGGVGYAAGHYAGTNNRTMTQDVSQDTTQDTA